MIRLIPTKYSGKNSVSLSTASPDSKPLPVYRGKKHYISRFVLERPLRVLWVIFGGNLHIFCSQPEIEVSVFPAVYKKVLLARSGSGFSTKYSLSFFSRIVFLFLGAYYFRFPKTERIKIKIYAA
jgi:hypothetical protein